MMLSQFIATRLTTKKNLGFIGFVARVSSIGVGVGCASLILLLSVMNGFEYELRTNLLSKLPHAEFIQVNEEGIFLSEEFLAETQRDPRITEVFQINKALGLVQDRTEIKSTQILGVDERYYTAKHQGLYDYEMLVQGRNIVVGKALFDALELEIGKAT